MAHSDARIFLFGCNFCARFYWVLLASNLAADMVFT